MKISVVTISFNQAEFLERTILSVIGQKGIEFEYIIVDPGSSDGSREIIERYKKYCTHIVYEKDEGPADGLNRGFALASGDVYCYLNSDDTFEPDAFIKACQHLDDHPQFDVICGHAWVTDRHDNRLRRVWSEPFGRLPVAYGAAVQIQPSTFIRRASFIRSGGFRVENRSNWDGELLVDLFQTGASIGICNEFLSCYRLHDVSITNSGRMDDLIRLWNDRRFEKLMNRRPRSLDRGLAWMLRLAKHATHPRGLKERLMYGPLYRRGIVE